jgi:hypothetical protein
VRAKWLNRPRVLEMLQDKPGKNESAGKRWDEHAKRYDAWYEAFEGAVEHYVD